MVSEETMAMFRSEDMTYCQLFLQPSATYDCVAELGEVGLVQFKDLNVNMNAFNRKFVSEIRRCEEVERKLRYFEREIVVDKLTPVELHDIPRTPDAGDLIDMETELETLETQLRESTLTLTQLEQNRLELAEMREVLKHFDQLMMEANISNDLELRAIEAKEDAARYTGCKTGVLPFRRLTGFMRTLYYGCFGQIIVKFAEVDSDLIGLPEDGDKKAAFIVFFQGQQIELRVDKIIASYSGTRYPVPMMMNERRTMKSDLDKRIQDLDTVVTHSRRERREVLERICQHLTTWQAKSLKVKAVYYTMNMFHTDGVTYIAECWVPSKDFSTVQMILNNVSSQLGVTTHALLHPVETRDTPPTYFRLNKFTGSFQAVIDAYGVPTYKEVNPALFALISFPFLFGVMFGDFAHGFLMFLFALWMCVFERRIEKTAKESDMFSMIYAGRYLVLMMGIFSIYAGFLYNECFAKSVNIFGTKWTVVYDAGTLARTPTLMLDPNDTSVWNANPYPLGIDPIWAISYNKISFTNSYKEKLSVILGVSQMTLGVLLSIANHVQRRSVLDFFCRFVPEIVFLLGMFGYLVALVITKWLKFTSFDSSCAPSLLVGYINMFLFSYPATPCYIRTWYPGQQAVQMALVFTCLIAAVWMLFSKPCILRRRYRNQFSHQRLTDPEDMFSDIPTQPEDHPSRLTSSVSSLEESSTDRHHIQSGDTYTTTSTNNSNMSNGNISKAANREMAHDEFVFGEVMINQAIHTIEFCLGCISHTASYLRLWALSLAHSQLSEVLWNMVLRIALRTDGYLGCVMIFLIFPAFAWLTIGILLVMEGLSAFLHTLRLHWIEFQTKFYAGEGTAFIPFSFKTIMEDDM